ncbi:MAG: RNA polymerase subunit sigma-70 [Duncaniella sp.]|nr:RNA polymerase subunit sigma-70 [Duncaniella sp.]MDE6325388.1 RNA polymerase subunit sigma-70 [Duncaniella sp.]MDE6496749.1 RNA polymerase subunit sigma-70 [Duncaniella sp.]
MENFSSSRNRLISDCYMATHNKIERFIGQRVNDICEAENLTQDVYLKLLEYDKELTADTITSLVYTIARNIVNDYLRHAYRTGAVKEYLRENSLLYSTDVEAEVSARDIAVMERSRVERLPRQRRIIYVMSRYFEKSIADISTRLSLSTRTVENHLRMGRRDVREYMAMVI